MKACFIWFLCFLLFSGCSSIPEEIETGMKLRSTLLQASGCSFDTAITADYGDKLHSFSMHCAVDPNGDIAFSILKPDTISGITGKLSSTGGKLTFDDTALHFELMADGQLSPISAPWIFMNTLRSGYLSSACRENQEIRLSMEDSYENDSLRLDIWLDSQNYPNHADILYAGRRILSLKVENFQIL